MEATILILNGAAGAAKSLPRNNLRRDTWNGILKLKGDGSNSKIEYPIVVKDCDTERADHNPANAYSRFSEAWA